MAADQGPTFYYDLGSPYSYLAAFRLDRVLPVAPSWQPVWIGPILAAAEREWRRPEDEVRQRHAEIEERAATYGIPPWRWPEKYLAARELGIKTEPLNTLAVMRLATYAHGQGVGEPFARRVFHLAFGEGQDITSITDQVIGAAVDCGLDADAARAAVNDSQIKQDLRDATEAASARGVTGLPTVAMGDELFWGDDRLEDAAAVLERVER